MTKSSPHAEQQSFNRSLILVNASAAVNPRSSLYNSGNILSLQTGGVSYII